MPALPPTTHPGGTVTPAVGRTVLYKLSAHDAEVINRRRTDYRNYIRPAPADVAAQTMGVDVTVFEPGKWNATGHQAHVGNDAAAGQVFPAVVVRTFGGPAINLHVILDGSDDYWVTSVTPGDGEGQWAWPERIPTGMFATGGTTGTATTYTFGPIPPQPIDGPVDPTPRGYEYPVGG